MPELSRVELAGLVLTAIAERRLVEFWLHNLRRVGEPHVYGVHRGIAQLLIYQLEGQSNSGPLPDWRRANLDEVVGFRLLDLKFATSRPTPSGRHTGWDKVLASVSSG